MDRGKTRPSLKLPKGYFNLDDQPPTKKSYCPKCSNPCTPLINRLPMFRLNEDRRIRWDLFIMVLATFNCISLPYESSFSPDFMSEIWFIMLNLFIDMFFFADIVISFRTTMINNKSGTEINDPREIAKYYLKGRFLVDFLSTFPFDYTFILFGFSGEEGGTAKRLRLVKILKLVRILRL
jgi:hypothetical protein